MKKQVILIVFALSALLLLQGCNQAKENQESKVCFGENCFNVEIANTPESRAKGLMFRESLGSDKGMLFVFEKEEVYPFWMKNTLIPLDMIWMDSSNSVVFIAKNATPCKTEICPSISPGKKALYVLEINAGISDKIGIKSGDRATFKNKIEE